MILNGANTSTELIQQKQLVIREPQEWGELRLSMGAIPLLGLALPNKTPALLPYSEPSIGDVPPINITIGALSEVPALNLEPKADLGIFNGYDHRKTKPAQLHVLLSNDSEVDPAQKFDVLLDTIAPVLRQWLPTLPGKRESYRIGVRHLITRHLAGVGAAGYLVSELSIRGDVRWVECVGGAAIFLTGAFAAEQEQKQRTTQLRQLLPRYQQSGFATANNIVTDLGKRFATWQRDMQLLR